MVHQRTNLSVTEAPHGSQYGGILPDIFQGASAIMGTCRRLGLRVLTIPDNGPRLVFEAYRNREYSRACSYFVGGFEAFQLQPELMEGFIFLLTDGGRAESYSIVGSRVGISGMVMEIGTFADIEQRDFLQSQTWAFDRHSDGWAITGVRPDGLSTYRDGSEYASKEGRINCHVSRCESIGSD